MHSKSAILRIDTSRSFHDDEAIPAFRKDRSTQQRKRTEPFFGSLPPFVVPAAPQSRDGTLLDVPAATAQRALLPPPRRQHPGDALCHMSLKMQRIGARTISCNLCVQLIFSGKVRSCPRSKTAYCSNRTSSLESLTCHTFSSSYSVKQASISACL
jgi:hypothetical protein